MAAVEEMGRKNPAPSVKPHYSEIASLVIRPAPPAIPKACCSATN
ncbi:MAG: hypothetical protein R2860_03925 [Desulfobacterales bacterium]